MAQTLREKAFAVGLYKLATSCRQVLDDLTVETYTESLVDELHQDEWTVFVREAIRAGRFEWFPKVTELLEALREFRGGAPVAELDREAATAYERVIAASAYSPELGAQWTYRGVLERCGRAAADAFLAAGAHHAFATLWKESDRRERFLAAYVREARAVPTGRLLPAGPEVKALPAPTEPTPAEAKGFLDKLRALVPDAPTPRPMTVVTLTPEREAELKRQAEALRMESAVLETVDCGTAAKEA